MSVRDDWLDAALLVRGIRLHRSTVTVIDREEGYREFHCLPPWFSQDPDHVGPVLTELVDQRWADDPDGLGLESDMWSASGASLRLRTTPADRLDLRERQVLASRTVTGLNRQPGWLSDLRERHQENPMPATPRRGSMWDQLGMASATITSSVSGWGIEASEAGAETLVAMPAGPSTGRWFRWSTLRTWPGWRRGQDGLDEAVACGGELGLFVSHRWERSDHPDPHGTQFQTLLCGLSVALASAVQLKDHTRHQSASGLAELLARYLGAELGAGWQADQSLRRWARLVVAAARRARDLDELHDALAAIDPPVDAAPTDAASIDPLTHIRDRVVIWYDYSSMFQRPRSAAQERIFRAELAGLAGVQRGAATVVLAAGDDYLGRGWCFLELAGALRGHLVDLHPESDAGLRTSDELLSWATRTDQLAGALATLGSDGIHCTGLRVSDHRDLPAIGDLIARMPALGAVRSDDSDIVGGVLPYPRLDDGWVAIPGRRRTHPAPTANLPPLADPGRVPDRSMLTPTSGTAAGRDALTGDVGVWCFATSRTLALAWAARAVEIWGLARPHPLLEAYRPGETEPAVAAAWTDAWSVADDGEGMTRAIPSTVRLLVIITQEWVSRKCLIRQSVLDSHLAADVPVAVVHPFERTIEVHDPVGLPRRPAEVMDVWARPRMRRDTCRINQLFLDPTLSIETVEVRTALRRQIWDPPLSMATLRAAVEAHPEWGFDTAVSDRDLLDQCSLHDLQQRIPLPG
jgi:hypothetical protein